MSSVAKAALGENLTGFEFASGIPGSIGGAVFMNAGAYGGEMKDIVEEVTVVKKDGSGVSVLSAEDMDFPTGTAFWRKPAISQFPPY